MLEIKIPLRTFYKRCVQEYHMGDTSYYADAINTKERNCYNPHISTEADVQIKLGGIVDAYLRQEHLPFSVNSEMGVYPNSRDKADLTIHRISSDMLYLERDIYVNNLECVIEIKYANARQPDFDFGKGAIEKDILKLNSFGNNVKKVFAFIDEADNTSEENLDWLMKQCREKEILLFSNNKYVNQHLNFPYA